MSIDERPKTAQELKDEALNWYTPRQAAEYFGCLPGTIYAWIHDGCIVAEAVTLQGQSGRPGKFLIPASEIDRIDREGRTAAILQPTRRFWVRAIARVHRRGKYAKTIL